MSFHDHHFHPLAYAQMINGLELMSAADLADVLGMVADRAAEVEGAVIGHRLNDESVAELRLPVASDIDGVVSERPVLLYRYCGHVAVANSAALALAGVDPATPDPRGGSFDRDPAGRPTGVLRETAIEIVSRALAPLTPPPSDDQILSALATLPEMGIGSVTGIVSAADPILSGVGDELGTLARLAPDLPIDIDVLVITHDPGSLGSAKRQLDEAGGRVRFHGWKDFSDGSFGGHTAAMHEPFADRPDTTGTVRLDAGKAMAMAEASLAMGGVVAIHAIGDLANDMVLDVMEDLRGSGAAPERLRIEHASILTGAAIDRMARLGVTASVQPAFLASEETWLERRLGPERMGRVYPFRSLLEAGVPLIGGSDAPVEHPDPSIGISAAVDRHGINPPEALTRAQAEALFSPPRR
jgi:predicted amidohydrolase YtcJ